MTTYRIEGKDVTGIMSVGQLKKTIADIEAREGKSINDWPVHIMNMTEDSGYATWAEVDCFDTDTGDDPDDNPETKAVTVLSLLVWPDKKVSP